MRGTMLETRSCASLSRACRRGNRREGSSGAQVPFRESGLAAIHRVRKVIRDVDVNERRAEAGGIQQIGTDDVDRREAVLQRPRIPSGKPQLVRTAHQRGHQPAADVAAGADDQDPHGTSMGAGPCSLPFAP